MFQSHHFKLLMMRLLNHVETFHGDTLHTETLGDEAIYDKTYFNMISTFHDKTCFTLTLDFSL